MDTAATWGGSCVEGLAEGTREIVWVLGSDREESSTDTGQLNQGKRYGQWVERDADGDLLIDYVARNSLNGWIDLVGAPQFDPFPINESTHSTGAGHLTLMSLIGQ